MVPATAAKYSEINIPQQSIEGVKNKKKVNFWTEFFGFLSQSVSVQGPWKVTLLSPWWHLSWSAPVMYYEVSFLKHEIESICENLAFDSAGEQGGEEVGGKGVRLNHLKITIRKQI